jgi:hypothetical protein
VPEQAILVANPDWTGHAGGAIRLPPGSVPQAQWTSALPPVTRVEDLPFGISGYYPGRDNRQKRVALSFLDLLIAGKCYTASAFDQPGRPPALRTSGPVALFAPSIYHERRNRSKRSWYSSSEIAPVSWPGLRWMTREARPLPCLGSERRLIQ